MLAVSPCKFPRGAKLPRECRPVRGAPVHCVLHTPLISNLAELSRVELDAVRGVRGHPLSSK